MLPKQNKIVDHMGSICSIPKNSKQTVSSKLTKKKVIYVLIPATKKDKLC